MSAYLDSLVERLGWTLAHSLWQFCLIAVAALVVLRLFHRAAASTRYLVACAALGSMLAAFAVTFAILPNSRSLTAAAPPVEAPTVVSEGAASLQSGNARLAAAGNETEARVSPSAVPSNSGALLPQQAAAAAAAAVTVTWRERLHAAVAPWLGTAVTAWLIGVLLLSARPAVGWMAMHRLRRIGVIDIPMAIRERAQSIANRLGIARAVEIVQSTIVDVPTAFGWLKPIVLIPVSIFAELSPQQIEAVIAHELAHIRRHDYLVNIAQTIIETLFFFHPAVWWISHVVRCEREVCCDELSIGVYGDRLSYVRALLALDELRGVSSVLALSSQGGSLRGRVGRILGVTDRSRASGGWAASSILLCAIAWAAWWTLAERSHGQEPAAAGTSARLQLLDSAGQPVSHRRVVLGHIGYDDAIRQLPSWASNRQGLVEVKGLEAGTHTLVANPTGLNPTIFALSLPAAADPVDVRLEPLPAWRPGANVELLEARSWVTWQGEQAMIIVELTNKSAEAIAMPMLSLSDLDVRVFLPERLRPEVRLLEAHRTQEIQLDWTRIVKEGVWTSRGAEMIDESFPLDDAPEGQQYFRLKVSSMGLLHMALPKPSAVLQREGVADGSAGSARDYDLPDLDLPLGNYGRIPWGDIGPAPPASGIEAPLDEEGWIDAEYYLQYRIRVEQRDGRGNETHAALPLLFLDLRNRGKLDLAIALHQSRQFVVVEGVTYDRDLDRQPWGGLERIPPGGAPVSIPFLLSPDWKPDHTDEAGLELAPGKHAVEFRLHLHELYEEEAGRWNTRPRGNRILTTRPVEIEVAQPPDGADTTALAIENIRRELIAFPRFHAPVLTNNLRQTVLRHQRASGDFLLTAVGEGNAAAPDPASFVIASMWDTFTHSQIDRYLRESMSHFIRQREAYPQGVDAGIAGGIRFEPGYKGLPQEIPKVTSKTTSRHYLDGRQIGEPNDYGLHTTISHWFRTGDLAVGPHTFHMVTDYEFQRGDEVYRGRIESPQYRLEIVPDTGDELLAPADYDLDKLVRQSLVIDEVRATSTWGRRGWQPQSSRVNRETGEGVSLHTPIWEVREPLPVDLCFEVMYQIEGSEERIPGDELVVFAGDARSFYFGAKGSAAYAKFREHADGEGFVKTRVVLIPSRRLALSYPQVKQYYGGTITSDVVRFRVDRNEIGEEFMERNQQ